MHNLTRGLLRAGHPVKVLCISTPKQPLVMEDLPPDYAKATRIEGIFVDTSVNLVDAFTDLLTADNYNISRFFSPDMDIRLIRLLSEEAFDVVQLESLFMTPYIATIRRYSQARVVLRSHNLEYVIQDRIATGERNFIKRPYRRFLAKQLRDYEMAVLDRVDGVVAISPSDADHFKAHGTRTPIVTVPFGVDPEDYPDDGPPPAKGPTFFHLGSMDWLPNEEGIRWLIHSVWPKVLRKCPEAQLHLAGNKMPKDLIDMKMDGLRVKGRVKNAVSYMRKRHVMVVPLFSAGGMRVKIIEGMAMGKAVIATPIGAEGIAHKDGRNILLAETASEFAEHMVQLFNDPERAASIGSEAHKLVKASYSDGPIVQELVAFYKRLLKG
ncbi:MAG: glycosyltransferase family 4 protein [Flavobacteriales bacterium]|nr:glycosyltransferase family 4 protein [Flavobacteriales bacterium]